MIQTHMVNKTKLLRQKLPQGLVETMTPWSDPPPVAAPKKRGCRMKHTQGKWKFIKANVLGKDKEFDHLIFTEDKRHVAEVFQYQNDDHIIKLEEAQANARLIASAPELLEALKSAEIEVNKWHSVNTADNDEPNEKIAWKCLKRIQHAIARAEEE